MMRVFRYTMFVLLALIMLSLGCSRTTSPHFSEERINNILYNMKKAYNDFDIDTFMQYFHYDYLHNGFNRWMIEQLWLNRMGEYQSIDFQNIIIEVDYNRAIVYFTMQLQNQYETVYTVEPQANGDISYFVFDNYDWRVFGNQHNF